MKNNPTRLQRYEKAEDGDFLIKIFRDPEYREVFRRVPKGLTKEDIRNYETFTESQLYIIFLGEEKIGLCMISKICNFSLSFQAGIVLLKEYHDQVVNGMKLCFWAMNGMGYEIFGNTALRKAKMKILAYRADLENTLIKGGFIFEGRYPKEIDFGGEWQDEIQYSMIKEDFYKIYGR